MGHNRGYARYVVSNAVKKLTDAPAAGVATPVSAQSALIQNTDPVNDLMWRDDGTDPTATEGMLLRAGATLTFDGDLTNFRMIRAGGADVTSVRVSYYSAT